MQSNAPHPIRCRPGADAPVTGLVIPCCRILGVQRRGLVPLSHAEGHYCLQGCLSVQRAWTICAGATGFVSALEVSWGCAQMRTRQSHVWSTVAASISALDTGGISRMAVEMPPR